MNIVVVRDDGALLVSEGGDAAALITTEGVYPTTVGAAIARGEWLDPTDEVIPEGVRAQAKRAIADAQEQLGESAQLIAATSATIYGRAARVSELRKRVTKDT